MDEPSHLADVADYDALRPAFDGIDSVIHLAGASEVDSTWEDVLQANIVGTRNVFAAAADAGVAQVVYASSTHAVAMHEREAAPQVYDIEDARVFDESVPLRPDSLYGASKAFGEVLGRFYSERHGLRVICVRIGWVNNGRLPQGGSRRAAALWLSDDDCVQLFRRALEADDVRYAIVYGTSDNARQIWDLSSARRLLGFDPRDGAA